MTVVANGDSRKFYGRSRSFQDVHDVTPDEAAAPALKKARRVVETPDGKEQGVVELHACQEGENDYAEVVVVYEPEGTSLMMGGLHPRASLFEKPVNAASAKASHTEFRRVMRENGVKVLTVRDILSYAAEEHIGARVELENLALRALTYELAEGFSMEDLAVEDRFYLSDGYKRSVLEHMSLPQLLDTLLINATVYISPSYRDTGLTASYSFKPLSNLVYTRDQQITTCKGIVMARLRSTVRELEVALMRFCFEKLGVHIEGAVREPGYLEGGDYCPASADLHFVGVGLRSNMEAVRQLMDEDLFGARRVAVVRDQYEQSQDRMHLDCVFSIVGDDVCIMMDEMMGESSPTRRLVDEWVRPTCPASRVATQSWPSSSCNKVRDPVSGKYAMEKEGIEFARYLTDEGWHIIPIKAADQLMYGCNVLNLGSSRIISVNPSSARQIVNDPHFKGDVQVIDFSPITSMYGAVHCSSQVIKRTAKREHQRVIQTSDGQRMHWPPRALKNEISSEQLYQQPSMVMQMNGDSNKALH